MPNLIAVGPVPIDRVVDILDFNLDGLTLAAIGEDQLAIAFGRWVIVSHSNHPSDNDQSTKPVIVEQIMAGWNGKSDAQKNPCKRQATHRVIVCFWY